MENPSPEISRNTARISGRASVEDIEMIVFIGRRRAKNKRFVHSFIDTLSNSWYTSCTAVASVFAELVYTQVSVTKYKYVAALPYSVFSSIGISLYFPTASIF